MKGWKEIPNVSKKWHFFDTELRGDRSICGRFMAWMTDNLDDSNHNSPDNCLSCRTALYTLHPELFPKGKPTKK